MKRSGKTKSRSDKSIATRVKALMEERQWDQRNLAQALDLSEGYISRILSGERPWPLAMIFKVSQAMKVPVKDLDEGLEASLLADLQNLGLRHDVPHLQVLYSFVRCLPRITDQGDLVALNHIIEAFGDRVRK